jgi:hypothetical protein
MLNECPSDFKAYKEAFAVKYVPRSCHQLILKHKALIINCRGISSITQRNKFSAGSGVL